MRPSELMVKIIGEDKNPRRRELLLMLLAELPLKTIAANLKVTPARISQLKKNAFAWLRKELERRKSEADES